MDRSILHPKEVCGLHRGNGRYEREREREREREAARLGVKRTYSLYPCSSSSDSGFDVSFESPKHEISPDTLFPPVKEVKRKKMRNTRCKSPTQFSRKSNFFSQCPTRESRHWTSTRPTCCCQSYEMLKIEHGENVLGARAEIFLNRFNVISTLYTGTGPISSQVVVIARASRGLLPGCTIFKHPVCNNTNVCAISNIVRTTIRSPSPAKGSNEPSVPNCLESCHTLPSPCKLSHATRVGHVAEPEL
ncbi:hypothetical protein ALC62_12686 [Cyphomyrmex costatus]|uniref:Uncharacterized protein n=1 Tax=Cyphomyrmex costatus TaxID=456900 RepID=A0A195C700_9HYME|nr:hypothetical protein ALC62_12686 [Cyphomyrmex costatus]